MIPGHGGCSRRDRKLQLSASTRVTAVSEICSPAICVCEVKTEPEAALAEEKASQESENRG